MVSKKRNPLSAELEKRHDPVFDKRETAMLEILDRKKPKLQGKFPDRQHVRQKKPACGRRGATASKGD